MNANDILDMIADAKGSFVWDAQQLRTGSVSTEKGRRPGRRTLLVAALVAALLLLAGCAIACMRGWFVDFFAGEREQPLSDSQITLIQENEQIIGDAQSQGGWTVELCSVWNDNSKAYILIGITAPAGVDLEPAVVEDVITERFSPGNDALASDLENPPDIVVYPKGVWPSSMGMSWKEDGDGLDNTKHYVIELEPDMSASSVDPFGPEAEWKIYIENLVRTYDDEEYRNHLLNTKYKGEYGVMFTPEETARIRQKEILVEGVWEFTFTFAGKTEAAREVELLKAPIQTVVEIPWQYGADMFAVVDVRREITVTSLLVQPLGVKVSYAPCGGWPNFWLDDGDLDRSDCVYASCVLQNGTRIPLMDWGNGGDGYKLLEAESPLVAEEVVYIQMPDGTKIHADGTVEYADREAPPAAVLAYRDAADEVYAYYADFDGDGLEDAAIWYGGAFRVLCLLNAQGEAVREILFEDGMNVYETYNQRESQIRHEPNQIVIFQKDGDISEQLIFRAEADGLHLSVGVRYDPNGAVSKWFKSADDGTSPYEDAPEGWNPITEETYRRIVEDYQVMQYRLIPIA